MTRIHAAGSHDDSLEREYRILATQHGRMAQSYYALAEALEKKRANRVRSSVTGKKDGSAIKPILPFPESELF